MTMKKTISIDSLDHLVLTVANIPQTLSFYQRVLGMQVQEFKPGRYALLFGSQKINLHEVGTVVDQHVRHATPGSADLCFLTSTALSDVIDYLQSQGVQIVSGPVDTTGAKSLMKSVYFYDPDENLIELSNEISKYK